jgi:hypothetical protein
MEYQGVLYKPTFSRCDHLYKIDGKLFVSNWAPEQTDCTFILPKERVPKLHVFQPYGPYGQVFDTEVITKQAFLRSLEPYDPASGWKLMLTQEST